MKILEPPSPHSGLPAMIRDDFRFYRTKDGRHGAIRTLFRPGFLICANYRLGHWARKLRVPLAGTAFRALCAISNILVSALTGSDIRAGAVIGRHADMHTTFGLVIADGAVIGHNCTFNSGVCIVNKANGRGEGQPRVGNNVLFGAGSKVLGGITVGDHAVIGANAVVLHDVPAHSMAFGIPARNHPLANSQDYSEAPNFRDAFGFKLHR